MKKLWIVSFLVFVMLLAGCEGTKSALGPGESKPAVTTSGKSFFWDKDLRPAVAVPSKFVQRPQVASAPEAAVPEPVAAMEPVPAMEPVRQIPTEQRELVTASVDELQPVTPAYIAPTQTYEKRLAGPGLVAVDETGGHVLSMTYPRPDYGIIQIDKTMPKEIRVNQPFAYEIKVMNLTDIMLTDVVITVHGV